ncbi:MAG: signal recognition particle-docking protein FtsY [Candidatus Abyssubacteria bacterium]
MVWNPFSKAKSDPKNADKEKPNAHPDGESVPDITPEPESPRPSNQKNKLGIIARLRSQLGKAREGFAARVRNVLRPGKIDDDIFEELEAVLIQSDMGVKTTQELIGKMRARVKTDRLTTADQLYSVLEEELISLLSVSANTQTLPPEQPVTPVVIMVIGVNGVGKTTTIGKLANMYRQQGERVLVAAADTFRAAAVEQLEIWAQRAQADLVKHKSGADPAAVAYDALSAGIARKCDRIIIDTAGRLHTKTNLMEELKKIKRVLGKLDPTAPHEVLMVLDATTGQNALSHARLFTEAIGVTGIALTKLDGTAKGGIVIAIQQEFGIPVKYIGIGETLDDLKPFRPDEFVKALFED